MTLIIHTAEIRVSSYERIIAASLRKQDVLSEVQIWRRDYPGKRVKYSTIIEEVER